MISKKYPEGHFIGVGMAIGISLFSGLGFSLSILTDNPGLMGIGPAIGVALGLAIGKSMEEKYRKQGLIRPLTVKEKKARKKAQSMGLVAVIAGIAIFLAIVVFNVLQ